MSAPDHARPPAWAALQPTELKLRHGAGTWVKRLQTAVGRPGRILGQDPHPTAGEGYFQFIPEDGSRRLFLKTVHTQRLASLLDANRIAEWLSEHALPVSSMLDSYPRRINTDYYLIAHGLIDARFARPEAADIRALGHLLGRTHKALSALPWAADVRARALARETRFSALQADAAQHTHGPLQQRLLNETPVQLPLEQGQVIHGDLNIGNLLFGKVSGQPVLLDFEDANHNWCSPLVDLAMALERFVLVCNNDEQESLSLGSTLMQAYRETAPPLSGNLPDPGFILRALATRALLLLDNTPESLSVEQERHKFLQLHQQTLQRQTLIERIWATLEA